MSKPLSYETQAQNVVKKIINSRAMGFRRAIGEDVSCCPECGRRLVVAGSNKYGDTFWDCPTCDIGYIYRNK